MKNIKRTQLDELRTLAAPPTGVRITIEAVATLLGETSLSWTDLRRFVQKKDFISQVANFDPLSISPAVREKVRRRRCLGLCWSASSLCVHCCRWGL